MRYVVCLLIGLMATAHAAVEWQPVEAVVIRSDGAAENYFIKSENSKFIECTQNPEFGWAQLAQSQVLRVNYEPGLIKILEYAQAKGALKRNDLARAEKSFLACVDKPIQALQIKSRLALTDLYVKQERYDDALKQVQLAIGGHKTWSGIPQLVSRMGDVLLAKGDSAAAQKTYAKLEALAKVYGEKSLLLSRSGSAKVLAGAGDYAAAASLLQDTFTTLDKSKQSESVARLGLQLASMQSQSDQSQAAQQTLRTIAYLSGEASDLGPIHVALADSYAATNDFTEAFDHACIAAVMTDSDAIKRQARNLALSLSKKIDGDSRFSEEQRLAFRLSLQRL